MGHLLMPFLKPNSEADEKAVQKNSSCGMAALPRAVVWWLSMAHCTGRNWLAFVSIFGPVVCGGGLEGFFLHRDQSAPGLDCSLAQLPLVDGIHGRGRGAFHPLLPEQVLKFTWKTVMLIWVRPRVLQPKAKVVGDTLPCSAPHPLDTLPAELGI